MNNLDYLRTILTDWATWVRQGKTLPNPNGFPVSSPGFGDNAEVQTETKHTKRKREPGDKYGLKPDPVQRSSKRGDGKARVPEWHHEDIEVERLDKLIYRLDWQHRLIIVYRYLYRFTHQQIASMLLISTARTCRLMSGALDDLERDLKLVKRDS